GEKTYVGLDTRIVHVVDRGHGTRRQSSGIELLGTAGSAARLRQREGRHHRADYKTQDGSSHLVPKVRNSIPRTHCTGTRLVRGNHEKSKPGVCRACVIRDRGSVLRFSTRPKIRYGFAVIEE